MILEAAVKAITAASSLSAKISLVWASRIASACNDQQLYSFINFKHTFVVSAFCNESGNRISLTSILSIITPQLITNFSK